MKHQSFKGITIAVKSAEILEPIRMELGDGDKPASYSRTLMKLAEFWNKKHK